VNLQLLSSVPGAPPLSLLLLPLLRLLLLLLLLLSGACRSDPA
jgi:hypothetical protein